MSPLKPIIFLFALIIFSCSNETFEEGDDPTPLNYTPNTLGDYWIYDVESTSADTPKMNFTGSDSLYIATSTSNAFTYQVNNGMDALGSMNAILVNGNLSKTTTTLKYTGTLDLPIDIPIDIPLTQNSTVNDFKIIDLDAANGETLSNFSNSFSETIDIQGTVIPVEISYSLSTRKENFYATTSVNGTTYTNVYEATLKLNLSVTGTLTLFGFTQTIEVIQPQDVLSIRYYFGGDVGLLRAESTQEFQLDAALIALIQQSAGTIDIPTSATTTSVEELNNYSLN